MSTAPLAVNQTEAHLRGMLDRAGVAATAPDALAAWNTFKEFSRIPVECADDGFLFEVLPYPERGEFSLYPRT